MPLGETESPGAFCTFWRSGKKPGIQLQLATTCCRHKDSLDSETLVPYQCVLKREDDLVAIRRFVCLPILTPSLAYFGPNHIPEGHHRYSNDHSRFIANKTVVIMVIITILSAYFWYHRILSSCFTHGTPTHGASITAGDQLVPERQSRVWCVSARTGNWCMLVSMRRGRATRWKLIHSSCTFFLRDKGFRKSQGRAS